jgi:predicted CXXCH cytochrome family protein
VSGIYGGDEYGHNVHGFGVVVNIPDILHLDKETFTEIIPPGYDSGYDPSVLGFNSDSNSATEHGLMCAGADGCHGNRDVLSVAEAMKGTHHADDTVVRNGSAVDGSQPGGGANDSGRNYRYLRGVHGGEDPDWQATKSTTDHNEYKGEAFSARTTQAWSDIVSISSFCAECHGMFHKSGATGIGATGDSPWIRHPIDVVMTNTREYAGYAYDVDTPIARVTIPSSPTDAVTDRVVMCMSCHRPHASPYKDALRWDYNTSTPLPNGTGCFACHTYKD